MLKNILVFLIGMISLVYLINPTAGILEFIPDNLPIVGNLDEMAATTLLVASLRYFGVDLAHIFKREKQLEK
jgi:uncharacterized membrane protein YkvA (DUF1232 family)